MLKPFTPVTIVALVTLLVSGWTAGLVLTIWCAMIAVVCIGLDLHRQWRRSPVATNQHPDLDL